MRYRRVTPAILLGIVHSIVRTFDTRIQKVFYEISFNAFYTRNTQIMRVIYGLLQGVNMTGTYLNMPSNENTE